MTQYMRKKVPHFESELIALTRDKQYKINELEDTCLNTQALSILA